MIQEGLYNMGIILMDKLEDFAAARREFIQLLDRYPDNTYRLDVYYNLYLMAVRQNNKTEAEKWRRMIIDNFPTPLTDRPCSTRNISTISGK